MYHVLSCHDLATFTEHTCLRTSNPRCGSLLVLDGNCTGYRDVCNSCKAEFIEFEELEEVVKTGCMNTTHNLRCRGDCHSVATLDVLGSPAISSILFMVVMNMVVYVMNTFVYVMNIIVSIHVVCIPFL